MTDDWTPVLLENDGALYERLIEALRRDIGAGVLRAGMRLPPQRVLAAAIGLSVGTVTKAYIEAERRGLVTGQVGRGTFVSADDGASAEAIAADQVIDLAVNVIPHQTAARRMAETLAAMRRRPDMLEALAYAPPAGLERLRRAAAAWIGRVGNAEVDWRRTVLTNGAQQGMALAFSLLCPPGDAVLCEEATFYGMKSIAEQGRLSLCGVAMDDEGVIPDALDRRARETGARVVYLMPTVQNPTARTMGPQRRRDVVEVARRLDLWIVEDDNYALFAGGRRRPEPLVVHAPERCFYTGGVSKSIAPGLRFGYLVCPSAEHLDGVLRAVRAVMFAPASLAGMFLADWIEDGTAYDIAEAVRGEVEARTAIAREILAGKGLASTAISPHLWLPMPELEAERLAGRALRAGVAVTPPGAPMAPGVPAAGIRLCLGAPPSTRHLAEGLSRLTEALSSRELPPLVEMV